MTPEEIIAEKMAAVDGYTASAWHMHESTARETIDALDAAGYQIVEKMPPNTVVHVMTDERGCIVRFEQKGDAFPIDAAKP